MTKREFKDKRGLTLLECVFAVTLFLIVFAGLLTTSNLANHWIKNSTIHLAAIYLCEEKIEEYKAMGYDSIPLGLAENSYVVETDAVLLDEGPDLSSTGDDLTGSREVKTDVWMEEGTSIGKKIMVTVYWTSSTGAQSQTLVTGLVETE